MPPEDPKGVSHVGHMEKNREGQRTFHPLLFPPFPHSSSSGKWWKRNVCLLRTKTTKFLFTFLQEISKEDFSGGSVVKTSCFYCRERRFNTWLEKFHMVRPKNKIKLKDTIFLVKNFFN